MQGKDAAPQGKVAAPLTSPHQGATAGKQAALLQGPGKGRVKLRASRAPLQLPSPRNVAAEAPLRGEAVPEEAARLGLPEELALTLAQACLPLTAAVQPKPELPPLSPRSLR